MSALSTALRFGITLLRLVDEGTKVTEKSKNSPQRTRLILGGIIVLAVVVAVVFVALSSQSPASEAAVDYSQIAQERQEDGGFVLGNPEAPITIVAFEDFLCGHCQRYKSTVDQYISKYVATGMARFEYRMLPVVDAGYSRLAGSLAECADSLRPGSFWTAHDTLYEIASARRFSDNSSRTFAEMMDMSYTELLACTQDATQVDKDTQLANRLSVTGTPTVFARYGDGMPQRTRFGQQPTFEQLGMLVQEAG